jgi:hypothetical protein
MMLSDKRVGRTVMDKVHVLIRGYSDARVKHLMVQPTRFLSLATAVWLAVFVSVPARADEAVSGAPLKCAVGPIEKTYGETQWLVYSCDDARSVIIVAAPLSPARPFVFRFLAQKNGYLLQSKGTGDKAYTTAAFGELKVMSMDDIEALVKLTKTSARQ